VRDQPTGNRRPYRVQRVLERSCDTEVAAATANGPEQIGVLVGRGAPHRPVGHDDFCRLQVVEGQAVFRHQPPEAAAERQSGDASGADDAAGGGQTVKLGFTIELFPEDAALRACCALRGIDVDALHRREIDHQAVINRGASTDVVTAAAYGDFEVQRTGELDGLRDVGGAPASRDDLGPLVDQPVVNLTRVVVPGIRRLQQLAGKAWRELFDGGGYRHDDLRRE
jgi:hypothetical protein